MADQTLEATGMRGDPIRHVAAVRAAGSREARGIDERIFRDGSVEALHQIVINFSAPIAADFRSEFLAVAERSPRVDHDDDVTGSGHDLLIPPVAPVIVPLALRATVNQE